MALRAILPSCVAQPLGRMVVAVGRLGLLNWLVNVAEAVAVCIVASVTVMVCVVAERNKKTLDVCGVFPSIWYI